jgi:hypothetical protein
MAENQINSLLMKLIHALFKYGLPVVAAGCLANPLLCRAAEETPTKPGYSTDPTDQEACQGQLNVIYGAIQEYLRRSQRLPRWLSELTPDFIHDPETLICPFVRKTHILKKWREDFVLIPVFGDSASSYAYEFCTVPIQGLQDKTIRDYKQRQMEVMGFGVPIVRCFAHRPVLNLAFEGTIYESPTDWEDNFVNSAEDHHFFHDVLGLDSSWSQNRMVMKKIAARNPQLDARLLDLSKHYNALLLHLSQIDHSGKLLATYPEGRQNIGGVEFDVRGLIHLTGKNFPISFLERVDNIVVNQKCAKIHFLHGAMYGAPEGVTVAIYVVHQGSGHTEIPIVYGKDVKTRWFDSRQKSELDSPKVAWTSPPNSVGTAGKSLRLYRTTWSNPNPDLEVNSISFVSYLTESAPFLVAITLE